MNDSRDSPGKQAAQQLDLNVTVERCRIEDLPDSKFDVVSARALAPLPDLLSYASKHIHESSVLLFLKGQQATGELTKASDDWHIHVQDYPSLSHPSGKILKITRLQRRT